jgi:Domain of unknown function (DUF4159)
MPTMQCPGCGNKVTFEGVAGVCPNCAKVVRVAKPAEPQTPAPRSAQPRSSKRSVKLDDLEVAGGDEEVFDPAESNGPRGGMDPIIRHTIVGSVVVIVLFALFVLIKPSSNPPPPVAVAPSPQPLSQGPSAPLPPIPLAPIQPVAPPPAPVATTQVAATRPAWMDLHPVKPKIDQPALTDAMVGQSIQSGADFLVTDLSKPPQPGDGGDMGMGTKTLATYSLLHAGKAISDSRLDVSAPLIQSLLTQIKKYDLSGGYATYSRSLRLSALALTGRSVDDGLLGTDLEWLEKSAVKGAYSYSMPPKNVNPDTFDWDHSNSQYGVLGVWAAADAGLSISPTYWQQVEQHWIKAQNADGGWPYQKNQNSTITMTCAALTTLSVASEEQAQDSIPKQGAGDADPAVAHAIKNAQDWISAGNHLSDFGSYTAYGYYGLERAGLATGIKWFGKHNWYPEFAAQIIKRQDITTGSWTGSEGPDGATAFCLLFLSRGRQPLMMNKLRWEGVWNDRPRDVSKLTTFVSNRLEQPFAWGLADLDHDAYEWLDSPVLFITTDTPPQWTDDEIAKLRQYTDLGGLIFIHNEWNTPAVDDFVTAIAAKAYPEYPLQTVPNDHLIYSAAVHLPKNPPLKAVSNGSRLLLVYSPTDLTRGWVTRKPRDDTNPQSQFGLNLFVYAAGKDGFRKRLDSPYIPPPSFEPIGTIPIARVQYKGNWDPEPGAWQRFPRWFQIESSIALSVKPTDITNLSTSTPIAVMTGNTAVDFSQMDLSKLRNFVMQGGILFIDAAGGTKAFATSVREQLLPAAFPRMNLNILPPGHPILAGAGDCTDNLPKARIRRYTAEQLGDETPQVQYLMAGNGMVIFSDLDISTGLVGSGNYGIVGYTPTYSQSLMKNVILWTLNRYHK